MIEIQIHEFIVTGIFLIGIGFLLGRYTAYRSP